VLDEDWDTSDWTPPEIEAACETLIAECEDQEDPKRTAQVKRMLIRLIKRHTEAVQFVETAMETLILKGLRTTEKKKDLDLTTVSRFRY
jgi:hypothetical protein